MIFFKNLKTILILLWSIVLSINICFGQCKDNNRVDLTYPCQEPYRPVCGCDNVTYRNICSAELQNGISPGAWRDGTCSGLEFDIVPTFTANDLTFTFVQPENDTRTSNLYIVDRDGVVLYYKTLYPDLSGRVTFNVIEVSSFKSGVYIMFLYNARGDYRFKKFVKY